jgi:hypothetical protein
MQCVRAAPPHHPTSRHVRFPTSLNRALLAEAFFSVNRQTRFAIVSCLCSQLSHICPGSVSVQQHFFKLYPRTSYCSWLYSNFNSNWSLDCGCQMAHLRTGDTNLSEFPTREVRRPLLSRGWIRCSVWVSSVDRVDPHRRSHLADLRQRAASVDWCFTADDARVRLRRLYPSIEP